MKYYSEHYKEYIDSTFPLSLKEEYSFLITHLKEKASILDIGFGSARDMLYFKKCGYHVYGIEVVDGFINHAKELGLDVEYGDLRTYVPKEKVDCIFLNAVLLHLQRNEIYPAIRRLMGFLNDGGILFFSMKYSEKEDGYDEIGRYFTYFHKKDLETLPFRVIDYKINPDSQRKDTEWIDVILRK